MATQGSANAGEIVWPVIPDVLSDSLTDIRFNVVSGGVVADAATANHYQWKNTAPGSFGFGWRGEYIYGPAGDLGAGMVGVMIDPGPDQFFSVHSLKPSSNVSDGLAFGGDPAWQPTYGNFGYVGYLTNPGTIIGLRFTLGEDLHYGWAEINSSGSGTTLHAFGYNNTPGAASHVVPEPSSIMLLAAGAAGLGLWRRKRSGKAA